MKWSLPDVGVGVAALAAIFVPVLSRQISDEFKAWTPKLAASLVKRAVRKLPMETKGRYHEEWLSHIAEVPGEVGKLLTAIGFVMAANKMSKALLIRRFHRVFFAPLNSERELVSSMVFALLNVIIEEKETLVATQPILKQLANQTPRDLEQRIKQAAQLHMSSTDILRLRGYMLRDWLETRTIENGMYWAAALGRTMAPVLTAAVGQEIAGVVRWALRDTAPSSRKIDADSP